MVVQNCPFLLTIIGHIEELILEQKTQHPELSDEEIIEAARKIAQYNMASLEERQKIDEEEKLKHMAYSKDSELENIKKELQRQQFERVQSELEMHFTEYAYSAQIQISFW